MIKTEVHVDLAKAPGTMAKLQRKDKTKLIKFVFIQINQHMVLR